MSEIDAPPESATDEQGNVTAAESKDPGEDVFDRAFWLGCSALVLTSMLAICALIVIGVVLTYRAAF